jgi:kynurenine formamidase
VSTEPPYDKLPELGASGLRHSWDVFGDALGTANRLTSDVILRALSLPTEGVSISLTLPLDEPAPPLFGRERVEHTVFPGGSRNSLDDRLDCFYPQSSTQWDGLGHVRAREFGFYGGRQAEQVADQLGIDHLARRGVISRGVLADVVGRREENGTPLDPFDASTIQVEDLVDALGARGCALEYGDVLCVRTGWIEKYRALSPDERVRIAAARPGERQWAGLSGGKEMARFLWDAGVAAVAADNPAVEVSPGDPEQGSLHRRAIACLGMYLGELFDFSELSERCARRTRNDFLFVSVPLQIPGGIGSPASAVAIL